MNESINDKKYVLQVFSTLNSGGAENRMMDVFRYIDKDKCIFDFISMAGETDYVFESEICQLGGTVYKISNPRLIGAFKHLKELRECMRKKHYSAVHAHTLYHCGIVMLAAWLEKIPVRVSHSRNTEIVRKNHFTAELYNIVGKTLIKIFSTKRIAISQDAGHFLFGKSNFEFVPNTIVPEKYQQVNREEAIKKLVEFGIPEDAFVIGQIGRLVAQKNYEFSLKWFSEYIKEHQDAYLLIIGDGVLKDDLIAMAKELGIEKKVAFAGARTDVPILIPCFDLMLFPSLFEGLGGVALEAQAAGIPIVESDVIPEEADLRIGMVKKCSLSDDFSKWSETVDSYRGYSALSYDEINDAFKRAGYTIEGTANRYLSIYNGK